MQIKLHTKQWCLIRFSQRLPHISAFLSQWTIMPLTLILPCVVCLPVIRKEKGNNLTVCCLEYWPACNKKKRLIVGYLGYFNSCSLLKTQLATEMILTSPLVGYSLVLASTECANSHIFLFFIFLKKENNKLSWQPYIMPTWSKGRSIISLMGCSRLDPVHADMVSVAMALPVSVDPCATPSEPFLSKRRKAPTAFHGTLPWIHRRCLLSLSVQ